MLKKNWKTFAIWILFTEGVGGISGWLTRGGMEIYESSVQQPPLSPPGIVFPFVWAVLYGLMAIGACRVYLAPPSRERSRGLILYFVQLAFNFLWSIIFFNLQSYGFALVWLILLWVLILWMTLTFYKVDRWAAWLQIPYLIWVAFAAYLNFGTWLLN